MIKELTICLALLLSCEMLTVPARAELPPLGTIVYQTTNAEINNPERGFFHFRDLTSTFGYNTVRTQGHSLIYGRILANDYRNSPFSQSFLDQIQAGFDAARANGIKVKPRVAYNDDGGADAPKSVILNHIQQLKPLWEANKDVIYHMDAGFIGGWGEWHSSTNGLDNNADRTEILNAILAALPADRMVGIRTPHFKREIFNGSPTDATNSITAANAFDGSNLSRVGHLNDCFLASSSDFGTYIYQSSGWSRQDELEYIGSESLYAPHGGETCHESSLSTGANAILEMETLHTDYLNIDYHPDVIQSWVDDGSFDEISRRLGYRYELKSAKLPDAVRPSSLLEIEFNIDNVGFGELFNPRNVEITLKNNATGEIHAAELEEDPRFWSGGSSNQVHTHLGIPADLPEGSYSVGIRMADIEDTLSDDVRYSIQFANAGIWDATDGINILKSDLEISADAVGDLYALPDELEEIPDPSTLKLAGDIDLDDDVDGYDLLALFRGFRSEFGLSDYELLQANYGAALESASSTQAVPEPATVIYTVLMTLARYRICTKEGCLR